MCQTGCTQRFAILSAFIQGALARATCNSQCRRRRAAGRYAAPRPFSSCSPAAPRRKCAPAGQAQKGVVEWVTRASRLSWEPPGSSRRAGGKRPSSRPLRRPAKKVRRGEDCVPKDDLFWAVKQSNSQKLPPVVVGRRTSENPPARLLLPGGPEQRTPTYCHGDGVDSRREFYLRLEAAIAIAQQDRDR